LAKDSEDKRHRRKAITDIGSQVPSNFKFGVIVAIAIFWADLLRSILNQAFSSLNVSAPILSNFVIAVIATVIAYVVMLSYRKIQSRLKRLRL